MRAIRPSPGPARAQANRCPSPRRDAGARRRLSCELVTVGVGHLRIPLTQRSPAPTRLRTTRCTMRASESGPSRGTICAQFEPNALFWRCRITSGCPLDALGEESRSLPPRTTDSTASCGSCQSGSAGWAKSPAVSMRDCDGARAILPTRSALSRAWAAWANARACSRHIMVTAGAFAHPTGYSLFARLRRHAHHPHRAGAAGLVAELLDLVEDFIAARLPQRRALVVTPNISASTRAPKR